MQSTFEKARPAGSEAKTSPRAGWRGTLLPGLAAAAIALGCPPAASADDAPLSVTDYGATGNGVTDDTAAIQETIAEAQTQGKSVFVPGGKYAISSTINLADGTLIGEGSLVEAGTARTLFIAKTAGMTMLSCTTRSRVQNVGLQGNYLANIGIKVGTGPRAYLANIEVMRCRKTSFLLAQTQNSCFINCYSSYSVAGFTLANGARNNNFYNCTSNNTQAYYNEATMGIPWSGTRCLYYVIDTADPDYGSTVTAGGNDRNNWFGGIHERAPVALVWDNRSGYASPESVDNQFFGVEFTCSRILSTQTSLFPGTITFDSCSFGFDADPGTFGVGQSGILNFQGEPYMSGGNGADNRGITQSSNYASLFVIDTDKRFSANPYNSGSITLDAANKAVTINGGGSTVGAAFTPLPRGNLANNATIIHVGKPAGFNAQLTYTVTAIAGSNPVIVGIALNVAPWYRPVASAAAPGTYTLPVRIGDNAGDMFEVVVSANGNSSCTVRGVSLKAVGF